jgi:hypothetical protein
MTRVPDRWHRVEVRSSAALARAQVSLIGAMDDHAIAVIDEAVQLADDNGYTLDFELGEMSSITPGALAVLLARSAPRS